MYRYASDEDVSWRNGHAADPRVEQGDLTSDPLAWCEVQMKLNRDELASLNRLWPAAGHSFEEETRAFQGILDGYLGCSSTVSHFIGGQYLSRAHRGDPAAQPPVVPVSRAQEKRAFDLLARYLFDASAFDVTPAILQHLTYAEWSGYGYTSWEGYGNLPAWAYNPPDRHDFPLVERINAQQMQVVSFLFQPLVLQRIDENPGEATARTMSIADLFDWLHAGIYGDLRAREIPLVTRNLQYAYTGKLEELANKPSSGTPPDAQALARSELQRIARDAQRALQSSHDEITRSHLAALIHRANAALK
jgi:hypothetical protein